VSVCECGVCVCVWCVCVCVLCVCVCVCNSCLCERHEGVLQVEIKVSGELQAPADLSEDRVPTVKRREE